MNKELYEQLLATSKSRRTAKQYDYTQDIDHSILEDIYKFTKTAPHSMGLELVRLISINRDSEHKQGVNEHLSGFNQERAFMSSVLTLFVTKKQEFLKEDNELLISRAKRVIMHGSSQERPYVDGSELGFAKNAATNNHGKNDFNGEEWLARQAYIHLGYLLLASKTLGVDTTTMEGFEPTLTDYCIEKGLIKEDERITLVVAMGYTDKENKGTFVGEEQLRIDDDEYVEYI